MSDPMSLFTPIQIGSQLLNNRIVMAPMTRLRAVGTLATPLMAEYYAQRAAAGLIITECTMVSPLSRSYISCPGIYSQAQTTSWRQVTDRVHAQSGRIFLQLWHCGRVSHPALLDGAPPIAPSAIAGEGMLHTPIGKVPLACPRALALAEIPAIVEQFRQGAQNAKDAGFDGVELHGAFGYLIDQFLQDGSNHRTDAYGGSIANRARFLLEVVEAVCGIWGSDRVGIRLSPSNTYYSMADSDPNATFAYVVQQLNHFPLAYIHLMEPNDQDRATRQVIDPALPIFRSLYHGRIITNGGYDRSRGNAAIQDQGADLVSFGRFFIANPDLPQRFAHHTPLNEPDNATLYGQGDRHLDQGYTDYPFRADPI